MVDNISLISNSGLFPHHIDTLCGEEDWHSDSKVIFEIPSENTAEFLTVESSFRIGYEEIQLEKLKINLD